MKTKSVFYIYGEPTTTISFKVPESKRKEIMEDIRENVLSKYENPARIDIEVKKQQKNNDIASVKPAEKKSTASGDDLKEQAPAISFERIASLPLGTELVEGFGSKGAIRKDENGNYYTKRTHEGKLEILKHKDYASALLYCEENFK